ncbi:helix-turn-helix transcriptional regulator [Arthrobacter cheniae]|uniref:Helix-turn-helix transcriptional regulator n=1 Tax=Arthrobacter cheniae TaxID=1258888 RepID=A0A3A5MCZ9_9MICC|nr:LuxR C-terminal-related transcriptional regulator [Arthrobacter cheniae]RJT80919.1 helix-turn-helix transcriptional regulator [Arthrobacter cheniae]
MAATAFSVPTAQSRTGAASGGGDLNRLPDTPSFVGRQDLLVAVEEALATAGSAGAVLVGHAGVGKTAVMQQVLSSRAESHYILRIRGSKGSRHQAYRPVNFLLSEFEADVVEHPVMVLRAVTDLLNQQARGRRVVLAVDNVEYLDPSSAALIGQLVLSETAIVLLTAQNFAAADPLFAALWRDGSLRRFDVEPFNALEARAFVETALEGPVSSEGLSLLHEMSGGNARFLQASTRALRGRRLVQQGASWVLLPGSTPVPTEIIDAAQLLLQDLPAAQQDIARVTALAGRVPLAVAQAITSSTDVDALQTAGLLAVRHGKQECVEFSDPVMAAGTAASLSALRAGELYGRWVEDAGFGHLLDPERHAEWLVRCHRPVPATLALAAARAANRAGRYSEAAAYAELEDAHRSSPAAAVELVRALTLTGRFTDAADAVLAAAPLMAQAPVTDAVALLLADATLRNRLGRAGVEETLVDAEERLAPDAGLDAVERARLQAEIVIVRAEVASLQGNFAQSRDLVLSLQASSIRLSSEQGISSDVLLCEAWGMMENQLDALQLAYSLAGRLREVDVGHRTREIAYLRLASVYSATGCWGPGSRELRLTGKDSAAIYHGSAVQLAVGLAHGRYGTPADALVVLGPAFDQLRVADPHRMLALAASAIAFCYTMADDIKAAIPFLRDTEPAAGEPWVVRRMATQLQLLSLGLREAKPEAAEQLQALGRSDRERGASLFGLSALTSSVRLGNSGALPESSDLAARVQGPFGHLCEMFAKGVGSRDAEVILQAMELAAAVGDQAFSRDAARSALNVARALGDKSTVRDVQQRARRVLSEMGVGGPASPPDCLTPREGEIAQLAVGGYTNREIAESMCVSVRTIEGHLYQIYSKLHISSRSQLAELLPAPL